MSLADDLNRDEGFRANPYLDSRKILTVGIGRNLEANPLTGLEWRALYDSGDIAFSITEHGAEALLVAGIGDAERQCSLAFSKWWSGLDRVRKDVIVNLCFNMGLPKLLGFRNMLAAVSAGDYGIAADELKDSAWYVQVASRGPRLVQQLRTGVPA